MNPYPLKFEPRLVPKMWGGRKLQSLLNKPLPDERPYGESWELFDFPPGATGPDAMQPSDDPQGWISAMVANGPQRGQTLHQLMQAHSRVLLGDCAPVETPAGPQFPLLIKFLDARDDLSVQVHPPPDYVRSHPGAHLKNEAWHFVQVNPGSRLLLGAKPGVDRAGFEQSLRSGTADKLMNNVVVRPGETFYMPSGTLHALGAGIVAYEVQTPSDTTFRVFDFNRIDPATGQQRNLHVGQALDCIQFELDGPKQRTERHTGHAILARSPQWILAQVEIRASDVYRFEHENGPIVMTVVKGSGVVASHAARETFATGETLLLPPGGATEVMPREPTRLLLAAIPPVAPEQLRPR